jgi:type II secretory pathway component PulJ
MARSLRSTFTVLALALTLGAFSALAEEPKLPVTAEDNIAMARSYTEKATAWRAEAAMHREMAAAYAKAHPDGKTMKNPWAAKMETHCLTIVKDVEKLAADADFAAKLHEARAKELGAK